MRRGTDASLGWMRRMALGCIVLLGSAALVGCGGGGGGGSGPSAPTSQAINGHAVPPEPEVTANRATVAGVDSNANGVRDDVERKLAAAVSDGAVYQSTLSIAREQQRLLTIAVPADRDKALQEVAKLYCAISKEANLPDVQLLQLLVDTPERLAAYRAFYDVLGGVDSREVLNWSPKNGRHEVC